MEKYMNLKKIRVDKTLSQKEKNDNTTTSSRLSWDEF